MPRYAAGFHDGQAPDIARVLDEEILRFQGPDRVHWHVPWFPPVLERRFEADTRAGRLHEINITLSLGVAFYWLTVLTDFAFLPHIGLSGVVIRAVPLPLLFVVLMAGPRLTCPAREWLLTAAGVVTVLTLASLPMLSAAPTAPLAFYPPMLAVLYGNTTIVARFSKSLPFTAVCCAAIAALAIIHTGITGPVGWAIALLAVITGASGLIANYRSERGARLAYLLNTRETQRLAVAAAHQEMLRSLSDTDALTGLANRGSFDRRCSAALHDPRNRGRSAALLMLDIDYFKSFNDHNGHIAGDNCLRQVARRISEVVRAGNNVTARYGGEEFVIFLADATQIQAEQLAERICKAVRELQIPHPSRSDHAPFVTVSIGVASTIVDGSTRLEELIHAADRALYAAKRGGRDRFEAALTEAA